MLIYLNEGASDTMYHFTQDEYAISMLMNDEIRLTPTKLTKGNLESKLSKNKDYYLSTTSTKSFDLGYQGGMDSTVRLNLNGRLIKSDFKIHRVAFFSNSERKKDMENWNDEGYDEMEDRIMSDKPSIKFSRYVDSITILRNLDIKQPAIKELLTLAKKRGIPVYLDKPKTDDISSSGDTKINQKEHFKGEDIDLLRTPLAIIKYVSPSIYNSIIKQCEGVLKANPKEISLFQNFLNDEVADTLSMYEDILERGVDVSDEAKKEIKEVSFRVSGNLLINGRDSYVYKIIVDGFNKVGRAEGTTAYGVIEDFYKMVYEKMRENAENVKNFVNEEVLNEGGSDLMFHFSRISNVIGMIKNDEFALSSVNGSVNKPRELKLNNNFQFFLSTTSTNDFNQGYQKFSRLGVRIDINGRTIKNNYKIKRVAFFTHKNRMDAMSDMGVNNNKDEMEDRILSNKPFIPFTKNVVRIVVSDDVISHQRSDVEQLVTLAKKRGIKIEDESGNDLTLMDKFAYGETPRPSESVSPEIWQALALMEFFDKDSVNRFMSEVESMIETDTFERLVRLRGYNDYSEFVNLLNKLNDNLNDVSLEEWRTIIYNIKESGDYMFIRDKGTIMHKIFMTFFESILNKKGTNISKFYSDTLSWARSLEDVVEDNHLKVSHSEKVLNEGVSDEVYHFRSPNSLRTIAKNDMINLSFSDDIEQTVISDEYPYYLSLSRTKSPKLGYQKEMTDKVRLNMDGRALNSNYKSKPVQFFGPGPRKMDREVMNIHGYDEFEDRVFSNEPTMSFSKYVKSVTVFGNISDDIIYLCYRRGVPVLDEKGNELRDKIDKGNILNRVMNKPNEGLVEKDAYFLLFGIEIFKGREYVKNLINVAERILDEDDFIRLEKYLTNNTFLEAIEIVNQMNSSKDISRKNEVSGLIVNTQKALENSGGKNYLGNSLTTILMKIITSKGIKVSELSDLNFLNNEK